MEFLDSRRLTGPNLLFDVPAVVLDIRCSVADIDRIVPVWEQHAKRMLRELGWSDSELRALPLRGGVSLAFTAAIDLLYAASEVNEWAWAACAAELNGDALPDFNSTLARIRAAIAEEENPDLRRLATAAESQQADFLWDDDEVSVGLGRGSQTWPARNLPDPELLDWSQFHDVPVGLVTGTNGKTTTVRMATHILRADDRNVGLSSTDWIAVNDHVIDRGDWSGPGGARAVLREQSVDVAVLEVARGGLLRRGLGVQTADAALITNIAADHLGDFGSQNLDELLNIKWIVSRAVASNGRLILNADDSRLRKRASDYAGEIVWFSLDAGNRTVVAHAENGGLAFVLDGHELLVVDGTVRELICRDDEIPLTLNGVAKHNIANALAAAALTSCLGVSIGDIRAGLTTMSQEDNPGRCNMYRIDGRNVLVDFAHNPQAMRALFDVARGIPAKRRVLCFGQAGDRPDALIRELVRNAWAIGLDRVIISELAKYYRGRNAGDIFGVMRDELLACGANEKQIEHHHEELDSLTAALAWAEPDDLVIMLALGDSVAIREELDRQHHD